MSIFDRLPVSYVIGGQEYKINSDFRIGFKAEEILLDKSLGDDEKVYRLIELYFPVVPPLQYAEEIVDTIIRFYTCKEPNASRRGSQKRTERSYDYNYDSDLIYSAFLQQYRVDLSEIEYMHWWKFRAMFNALSDETQFIKVVQYRTVRITQKMPKEQREFYANMKEIYALPIENDDQRKIDFVNQALLNGEDLDGITERYKQKYGTY